MTVRNSISDLAAEITAYRHELHRNPQTAYEEEFASTLIQEKLQEWGIPFVAGIAGTGVVATITGERTDSGKSIGIRADIDALDIMEDPAGKGDHASTIPGKMHGCGHDGHTAILLGTAKYLSENPHFNGTVHLIFQPAEEGAGGAHKMLAEGLFDRFPCDHIFAMHNWPRLPLGTIATRPGAIMAAADRFDIKITGKGGHAAMPQNCVDPIVVGSHIVTALQTLVSRATSPFEPVVLTVANFHAGTGAFNVIPDIADLSGTLRSFNQDLRALLKDDIARMCDDVAGSFGARASCIFEDGAYDPTINDPEVAEFCIGIAKDLAGEKNVDPLVTPSAGAEDFGAMLEAVPGCYIIMGQGEADKPDSPHNHGLHTPRYDFNDTIIPTAIEYWVRVAEKSMPIS